MPSQLSGPCNESGKENCGQRASRQVQLAHLRNDVHGVIDKKTRSQNNLSAADVQTGYKSLLRLYNEEDSSEESSIKKLIRNLILEKLPWIVLVRSLKVNEPSNLY